jgi:uncharacterized protein YxjI
MGRQGEHSLTRYGVEIAAGEDDVLLLASTVVIDMACHPDQRK